MGNLPDDLLSLVVQLHRAGVEPCIQETVLCADCAAYCAAGIFNRHFPRRIVRLFDSPRGYWCPFCTPSHKAWFFRFFCPDARWLERGAHELRDRPVFYGLIGRNFTLASAIPHCILSPARQDRSRRASERLLATPLRSAVLTEGCEDRKENEGDFGRPPSARPCRCGRCFSVHVK